MEKTTKKDMDNALTALEGAVEELEALKFPSAETYKDMMEEYREKKAFLVGQVESYFPGMEARTKEIIQAAKGKNQMQTFSH